MAKLATNESEDELVGRAVSIELHVRITCLLGFSIPDSKTVILANDDVHYVWLSTAQS